MSSVAELGVGVEWPGLCGDCSQFWAETGERLQLSIFHMWRGLGGKDRALKEFGSIQQILISLLLHRGGCRWLSRDIALVNNSSDTFTITKLYLGKNPKFLPKEL